MERYLVSYCSPTLAGLKTANLINYTFFSEEELMNSLFSLNDKLNVKGVYAEILRLRDSNALILVYRRNLLIEDFMRKDVKEFLYSYGYCCESIDDYISYLKIRLNLIDGFPHEIGLFLGYPLEDVVGFIKNKGKNSKYTGCWKVYTNESEAIKNFKKYKKCKDIYLKLFLKGKPVEQLTIVA